MKNVLIIMQFINTKFNRNILKITPNFFLLKQDKIYSFLVTIETSLQRAHIFHRFQIISIYPI